MGEVHQATDTKVERQVAIKVLPAAFTTKRFASVTTHDYYLVMTTVGIADLKARLSHYLRGVRRGDEVLVLDRDTPVARIVPYSSSGRELTIREPRAGAAAPGKVVLPPPLGLKRDVVELLLEERQVER